MYTIKPLPEFDAWFDSLKDSATRALRYDEENHS